jgi:hypothetical protein
LQESHRTIKSNAEKNKTRVTHEWKNKGMNISNSQKKKEKKKQKKQDNNDIFLRFFPEFSAGSTSERTAPARDRKKPLIFRVPSTRGEEEFSHVPYGIGNDEK